MHDDHSHVPDSGSGSFRQRGLEVGMIHSAEEHFGATISVDHDQSGLRRDTEASEDVARVITDLRKLQRVLVDEPLEGSVVARPRHADEVDPSTPLLCCCFDRRSFRITSGSSGGPEPKGHRVTGVFGPLELSTANQWCGELHQLGDTDRTRSRARIEGRPGRR